MSQEILVIDYANRKVEATGLVTEMSEKALAQAALVGKVTNADENEHAVAAQTELAKYIKLVKKAEDAVKEPLNDLRRKVIDLSKMLVEEADKEGMRLARLVGDFQEKERIRLLAENNAVNQELGEIQRKEATELSTCATVEEQDAVREKFAQQALDAQTAIKQPTRASGQVVSSDWSIEVTDIWALARAHPIAVKIEPRLSEIKNMLNAGLKVSGVKAEKITKATVRLAPERKAIEITP